jgi:hypothetical protein
MEHLKGRLITDEEQARWDADSKKRVLEFNAECRALGYNPRTRIFGFMLLNKLTDTDFQVKLSERYELWERNFVGMPIEIKKLEINKAKHELQFIFDTVEQSTDYLLYRKQKLEYLTTFIQKIEDAIHIGKLETMPTWAKEKELELIWNELLQLKWIDAKDKSNFFKAFGISKDSEPFAKVRLCDSATKLMVLLALMVDRKKKIISKKEKLIANNLFSIELTETKLSNNEFERWSDKLPTLNKLRKPIVIIPQEAGGLSY